MPINLDDRRLARRLLDGDERAFNRFFDDNFARLYRFALARMGDDRESTREVVMTTLNNALRSMHTYRAESAMFTWLCAICRNEITNWRRRQGRYEEHIVLVEDMPEVQAAIDSFEDTADDGPERHLQRAESLRLIQVALDRLPPRYGNVLEWKYIEGHSVRDIAARLDLGVEATQSLLARARRAFADVYGALSNTRPGNTEMVRP